MKLTFLKGNLVKYTRGYLRTFSGIGIPDGVEYDVVLDVNDLVLRASGKISLRISGMTVEELVQQAESPSPFQCFACGSMIEGCEPHIHKEEQVTVCDDCHCPKSEDGYHQVNWQSIEAGYSNSLWSVTAECLYCGKRGTLGTEETLEESMDW